MKLNYDCIRDILIASEKSNSGKADYSGLKLEEYTTLKHLKKYSNDEIQYHARQLSDANFIDAHVIKINGAQPLVYAINDLTWAGHELLNNLKNDTVFNKVKKIIMEKGGNASLSVVATLAKKIALEYFGF